MADTERVVEKTNEKGVKKLDIYGLLRDVAKDWWLILTCSPMCGMLVFCISDYTLKPQYSAKVTYVVTTPNDMSVYNNLSIAKTLATAFSNVLNSQVVSNAVREDLGPGVFSGSISASLVPETNLITLTVTSDTPEKAFRGIKSVMKVHHIVSDKIMADAFMQVLQSPTVPTSQINVNQSLTYALLTVLVAMLVLIVFLCYISYSAETVKNESDVLHRLDMKHMATLYHEHKKKAKTKNGKTSILISSPTTSLAYVETMKTIRTKLEYYMEKKGHKVLVVTSLCENEGKSTLSANIALSFAAKKKKVLLWDGDLIAPSQYKVFEVEGKEKSGVADFITGFNDVESLYNDEYGLYMLFGKDSMRNSSDFLSTAEVEDYIKAVAEKMDYVIIDTPPLSRSVDAECIAGFADAALFVVRQDVAKISSLNDALDSIESTGVDVLGCVFNNVHASGAVVAAVPYGYTKGRYGYGKGYGYGYGYGSGYGYGYGYGYGGYGDEHREKSSEHKHSKNNADKK